MSLTIIQSYNQNQNHFIVIMRAPNLDVGYSADQIKIR